MLIAQYQRRVYDPGVDVEFTDDDLDRMERELAFTGGWAVGIVKAFRKRMQMIRAAVDERDFYALKSLHFEKLKEPRKGQHSMRLNDQYRLIVKLVETTQGKIVQIIEITDYH
jgi:proteic killer suppression protein